MTFSCNHYDCPSRTPEGACLTTACTNPKYNGSETVILDAKQKHVITTIMNQDKEKEKLIEIERAIKAIEAALEDDADYTVYGCEFHYIIDQASKTALSVLREQEKREKGCDYCNKTESEYNKELLISTDERVWICDDTLGWTWVDRGNDTRMHNMRINYCPMCGKRLRMEDTK